MKRNTKQTKNNETNENPTIFLCFVIFRLFRVSLHFFVCWVSKGMTIMKRILLVITLFYAASITSFTQNPSPNQPSTRPPEDNDRVLRSITPEEVPPNLNFYAIDPLYKPGIPLGWAKERIEEKLDRGLIALATEGGKVYLSWRLLKTDPEAIAFNVY